MPIYFRARTNHSDDWYEIKSDDSTTVYDQKNQIMWVFEKLCLNTFCPENGWHKTFSMMKPRESCYSIAWNGKIYALGSCAMDEEDPYPWAEVLDTDLGGGGWTPLPEDKHMDFVVTGHAVLDGGNRILVHSEFDPCLYYYDVQDKCWGIYSRDFGYVDWTTPGVIYALVVSNGETVPKQVKGLEDLPFDKYKNIAIMNRIDCVCDRYSDDLDFEWVPAERAEAVAHPLAHKHYRVRASMYVDYLST
ncbi:hypothetical protein CsSME_00043543 [Camellia sinensis var. sinensis]